MEPAPRHPRTRTTGEPGPVVCVCRGSRCAALLDGRHPTGWAELRAAVRVTRGAVLVRTGCVGPCHLATVVLLGWRDRLGWLPLAGMDAGERMATLAGWLSGPGPAEVLIEGRPFPPGLDDAYADAAAPVVAVRRPPAAPDAAAGGC